MIRRFRITNYKILRELDLALEPFTMLVGPNACGKSSVLEALERFCLLRDMSLRELLGGRYALDNLITRGSTDPLELNAELVHDGDLSVGCSIPRDANAMPALTWKEADAELQSVSLGGEQTIRGLAPEIAKVMPVPRIIHFEHDELAAAASIALEPVLHASGRGLAAVLASLALEHPETFSQIKDAVKRVIPVVQDIRLRNVKLADETDQRRRRSRGPFVTTVDDEPQSALGHEILFDTRSGRGIPAHAMSDGTLRVLGLFTVLHGREPAKLILLDDLERGVHPRALVELVGLLQAMLANDTSLQLVASTHSPDLLDQLDPECIRLLSLDGDGFCHCTPMREHPTHAEWHAMMTPGEMWGVSDQDLAGREPA